MGLSNWANQTFIIWDRRVKALRTRFRHAGPARIDALERITFLRILIFPRTFESKNNFVPIESVLKVRPEV